VAYKLKVMACVENSDGTVVFRKQLQQEAPELREFEKQGFEKVLHEAETFFLDGRNDVCREAVKEYLEEIAQKKQVKKQKNL